MYMDITNAIRSVIFLVAGLIVIRFPNKVMRFQNKVTGRFPKRIRDFYKYPTDEKDRLERSHYLAQMGKVFLIIAAALFVFSLAN